MHVVAVEWSKKLMTIKYKTNDSVAHYCIVIMRPVTYLLRSIYRYWLEAVVMTMSS